jgi:hypothetical protein
VTVQLQQYGILFKFSSKVELLYEDDIPAEMVKLTGETMAEVLEIVRYGVLKAGSTVIYANSTSRANVNTVSLNALRKAARTLESNRAKRVTSRIAPGVNFADPRGAAGVHRVRAHRRGGGRAQPARLHEGRGLRQRSSRSTTTSSALRGLPVHQEPAAAAVPRGRLGDAERLPVARRGERRRVPVHRDRRRRLGPGRAEGHERHQAGDAEGERRSTTPTRSASSATWARRPGSTRCA